MPGVPDIKLIRTDTSIKNIVIRSTTLVPQGLRGVCVVWGITSNSYLLILFFLVLPVLYFFSHFLLFILFFYVFLILMWFRSRFWIVNKWIISSTRPARVGRPEGQMFHLFLTAHPQGQRWKNTERQTWAPVWRWGDWKCGSGKADKGGYPTQPSWQTSA